MSVYYDPVDLLCKSETGAVTENGNVRLSITVEGATECSLFLRWDETGEGRILPMDRDGNAFSLALPVLPVGLYYYHFISDIGKIGRGEDLYAVFSENPKEYQLLVVKEDYETPASFRGGVMYQIFPDRFRRCPESGDTEGKRVRDDWGGLPEYLPDGNGKITNSDFFGGNFKGVEEGLDYLVGLGVTHVYLNPVCEAKSNHRYDTGDYSKTDPLLGTEEELRELLAEGKKAGIRFILDGVYNHTGDDSVYFNKYGKYPSVGAYQSKECPYYFWYTFDRYPDSYESWWGIDTLPSVDKRCVSFQKFIAGKGGVLEKYFSLGFGGVRLDVVDELDDSFVRAIRKKAKESDAENLVIGEVWEDATDKIAYGTRRQYFQGEELDSVMNYPLRTAIVDFILSGKAQGIRRLIREQIDHYPAKALHSLMNVLGTHDTPRILTVFGKYGALASSREDMAKETLTEEEYARAKKMLFCAAVLQFTLYGVPCVYYGDEAGLTGNKDPFNRKCYPWGREDGELLSFYRFLGNFRRSHPCFSDGSLTGLTCSRGALSFTRVKDGDFVTVLVNCGKERADFDFCGEFLEVTKNVKLSKISLNTYEFAIISDGRE